jgi:hypothetical protein
MKLEDALVNNFAILNQYGCDVLCYKNRYDSLESYILENNSVLSQMSFRCARVLFSDEWKPLTLEEFINVVNGSVNREVFLDEQGHAIVVKKESAYGPCEGGKVCDYLG